MTPRLSRPRALPAARAGMTLIEVLIALAIFGVVITAAVSFMAQQNSAFQDSLVRLGALRNLRYSMTMLEQDVQTLGTNVPTSQPGLLYGSEDVIVFSADYATNLAADPFAVFFDPDAPAGQVAAPGGPLTVPTTAVSVADSVFEVGGVRSPAEIVMFYFMPDTLTARTDDFSLYRRVNDGTPEVVARNLMRVGPEPFLAYQREVQDSTGAVTFAVVDTADLPLRHTTPFHLAVADTGQAAWPDSVRAVRVTIAATNGLTGAEERRVDASRLIHLPNAGTAVLRTCGSTPLLGVVLGVTPGTSATGDAVLVLSWPPAVDEAGGEGDVVRYVLWKREMSQTDWGDPFVAIPAGTPSYTYEDAAVESGVVYQYALTAQDCTPSLSQRVLSTPVALP